MEKRFLPLVLAVGVLLIPAAAAQAATKDMFAGTPPQGVLKGVPEFATDNAFYPKKTFIHKGDRVRFQFRGFHNFFLPKKGDAPAELFTLNAAAPVSGVKDAAGVDFWFNGKLPSIGINPAVAAPTGGKTYNGKSAVGSGLPPDQGAPKPFKVRFTKKGTYTVYCSVHPGMKGKVVVKGKKSRITTKQQDRRRINKQKKAAAKLAKKLANSSGPSGLTVKAGNDKKGIATIAFFPADKTVKVGQQVTFTMSNKSTETHNVAFAPEAYGNDLAATFIGPAGIDPRSAYPSQPPGTPLVVGDSTVHGNGFVNTGLLDDVKATPLPKSAVVSFSKAGTFDYYCIVHGGPQGMRGKITVTP
jgi:plastocyanin